MRGLPTPPPPPPPTPPAAGTIITPDAASANKHGATLNMTANCSNQAYSVPPVNAFGKHGEQEFDYEFSVAKGTADTVVLVGYSSTGPKGIKLLSTGGNPPSPPGPAPAAPCADTEFCCPDAKACLTPTGVSCAADETACATGEICCPFTKECVTASHPCVPNTTCQATEFCCPDAKHCLKPVAPGTMCDPTNKAACPSPQVCCPLIKQCVSVGPACDPSAQSQATTAPFKKIDLPLNKTSPFTSGK